MNHVDLSRVIPAGRKGLFEVVHFTLTEQQVSFEVMRDRINRRNETMGLQPNVKYTRLDHVHRGVVMSNTPMEVVTNEKIIRLAYGNVLIAGLGLGLVLAGIGNKANIRNIVVVEKEQDVIDLVGPSIHKLVSCPLIIEHADIFKFKSKAAKYFDSIYDTIYFDIWDNVSAGNWEEMKILKRTYRGLLDFTSHAWMGCWREDTARNMARDERLTQRIHQSIIERRRSVAS